MALFWPYFGIFWPYAATVIWNFIQEWESLSTSVANSLAAFCIGKEYVMSTQTSSVFALHDVHDFPFVRTTALERAPGSGVPWQAEMQALLARSQPFVIFYPSFHTGEAPAMDEGTQAQLHQDRKVRVLWLKQYRQQLAAFCKGLITIEPDPQRYAEEAARYPAMEKAFGVPLRVAASRPEAEAMGRLLLA
jgi:hypothetical protein